MIYRYCLILMLSIMVLPFQNCGSSANRSSDGGLGSAALDKVIIASTAGFSSVVYDPALESAMPGASASRLEVDLVSGQVILPAKSCALEASRLSRVRSLLASSAVCEPGALPPDTMVCMAFGLADIELSHGGLEAVRLRPVICHSGTFLCNGNDASLRSLLADIQVNLPQGCH